MKKTLLFIFLLLAPIVDIISQSSVTNDNPVFNSAGLTYKSLLDTLASNKSFERKFEVLATMETIEPADKAIHLYYKLLDLARPIKDKKKYVVQLYSSIANVYLFTKEVDRSKQALDSAYLYLDQIEDHGAIGLYYYIEGRYFAEVGNEEKMIESYYKAIDNFDQTDNRKIASSGLLYKIAGYYYQFKDEKALESIMTRMLNLASIINEPTSTIEAYTVASAYYETRWNLRDNIAGADSSLYYNAKIITEYKAADDLSKAISRPLARQAYLNYTSLIAMIINKGKTTDYTWKMIEQTLSEVEILLDEYDDINNAKYNYLQAEVLYHKQENSKAKQYAEKSLAIYQTLSSLTNLKIDLYHLYTLLKEIEIKDGNYVQALKYADLSFSSFIEASDNKLYYVGKNLEIKYQTAEKDLKIIQLHEKQQKIFYRSALIVGILIIVSILLLVAFLYNRIKRLKKETEYLKLESEFEYNKQKEFINGLEAERLRLAKELHDGVSNDLVALRMQINANGSRENILDALGDVHANIRSTSHALMMPIFKETTLTKILYDYTIQQKISTGIGIELILTPKEDWDVIGSDIGLEFYRIVQESVSNAIKHGKATSISINGTIENAHLQLHIIDNGIGFDTTKTYSGIGLRILKNRADIINADLNITSSKEGTEVVIDWQIR